jgi:hypothetical protein
MSDLTVYEDGSYEGCAPEALCDDAASRAWPEHDGSMAGWTGFEIVIAVAVIWMALSSMVLAGYVALRHWFD